MEYIADNRIHALSIKAYTPEEWQRDRKLNGFLRLFALPGGQLQIR